MLAAGTCTIQANQAGNSSYAAATMVSQSFAVAAAGTQAATTTTTSNASATFSANAQNVTLSATVTSSSGTENSGTVTFTILSGTTAIGTAATSSTVASGAATATYAPPAVTAAGQYTIQAVYNAGSGFATSTGSGTLTIIAAPSFTLAAASSSMTISKGSSGTDKLTVTPVNGLAGTVFFACTGLPSGATCSLSPNTLTFAASSSAPQSTTLTISAASASEAVERRSLTLFPAATVATTLCLMGFSKRRRLFLLVLLAVSITGIASLTGCGGSSKSGTSAGSNPVTANVIVAATSGSIQQTTTVSLTVQ